MQTSVASSDESRVNFLRRSTCSAHSARYSKPRAGRITQMGDFPELPTLVDAAPLERKPLQFIVMSVMVVMSVTFPHTYRVLYMTVNWWCVPGASCHRHDQRHGENGLSMRCTCLCDGRDAHDGNLRIFSKCREGAPPLRGLVTPLVYHYHHSHFYIGIWEW
jgi:hypothetical protein